MRKKKKARMSYLKYVRLKHNLYQMDVIELTGVSKNRYIYMENHNLELISKVTYGELLKIGELYDMTPAELVDNYEKYNKGVIV